MPKAYKSISVIFFLLTGAVSAGTPASVFPIRSLVGDSDIGRSLRAYEDEQKQQILMVSIVQNKKTELSFDKDQYVWVENAMATLLSSFDAQTLDVYMRAAAGEFHQQVGDFNPLAAAEALKQEMKRQKLRLAKMGPCLNQPKRPREGFDIAVQGDGGIQLLRKAVSPVDTIDPPPRPGPGSVDEDTPVVGNPSTGASDDPCMEIQASGSVKEKTTLAELAILGKSEKPQPDPMLLCQPPAYVGEINWAMRKPDLERLYTDVCRRGLLSFPRNTQALDDFTGFILDLLYIPQRILRLPTFSARFRVATLPGAEARSLVGGLNLPKSWSWARLVRVSPRTINRPTSLVRDQLAYFQAWMTDTDLSVEVHYTFFGTSALRSEFTTPDQYVPADVSAWTSGDGWYLDSLGLSLMFTLDAGSFK